MYSKKNEAQKVTIHDVARAAGVSKSTISRYLNQEYESIALGTQKKIEEAIERLKYRPNLLARGLKSKRSNVIAMLLADIRNPYSTAILRGAEELCQKHNYSLMLCNSDNDPARERNGLHMLLERRVDGLIINSTGHNHDLLRNLIDGGLPVVLLDREVEGLKLDLVSTDNYAAMMEAMDSFLTLGYERFACFSEQPRVTPRISRVSAFRHALEQRGHPSAEEVYEVDLSHEQEFIRTIREACAKYPARERKLFIGINGLVTLKLVHAIQQMGLSIPGDIAVAGFDDLEWAPIVGTTGITTIAQETYQIGLSTMDRLLQRMRGDDSPAQWVKFPGKLMVRGSTPALPGADPARHMQFPRK